MRCECEGFIRLHQEHLQLYLMCVYVCVWGGGGGGGGGARYENVGACLCVVVPSHYYWFYKDII